jgi:hypothetical protein
MGVGNMRCRSKLPRTGLHGRVDEKRILSGCPVNRALFASTRQGSATTGRLQRIYPLQMSSARIAATNDEANVGRALVDPSDGLLQSRRVARHHG